MTNTTEETVWFYPTRDRYGDVIAADGTMLGQHQLAAAKERWSNVVTKDHRLPVVIDC